MEYIVHEVEAQVDDQAPQIAEAMRELSDLELVLVGGGTGVPTFR